MRVCLWWLQPLPRTPCPPPALSQAAQFLSRVGSLDAKPGMPVMRGGRGAATRRGREGAGGCRALFPGNTAGSELSGAVAWKDCSPCGVGCGWVYVADVTDVRLGKYF